MPSNTGTAVSAALACRRHSAQARAAQVLSVSRITDVDEVVRVADLLIAALQMTGYEINV